jgi:hypothetical protein
MMPPPSHLREIVRPADTRVDEDPFVGKLRCTCTGERFRVLNLPYYHVGNGKVTLVTAEIKGKFFFIIRAQCVACEKDHLIFDKDFHGWNGFVCHDEKQAKLKRPKVEVWQCPECDGDAHEVTVAIAGEGREDFAEETEGQYDEDRWPDAFGSIGIGIKCCNCGGELPEWVSYETM